MIKIAFCDDETSTLYEIHDLLDKYCKKKGLVLDYKPFHNPLDLIAEIERGVRFDILLLDVLMLGENGISAAAEIRQYDKNVKIIFLTSSAEFAVQSYTVGAYFYQLKPISEEGFFGLLDSVLSVCEKEQKNSLILRCKSGITRLELNLVEYCEVIHRTLFIHLTSGKVLESIGSLDDLSRQLMIYGGFLRVHRSYLVNMDYMQKLSYRAVTMSSLTEIPIPRGRYNEIKNAFLEYAFERKQVMV